MDESRIVDENPYASPRGDGTRALSRDSLIRVTRTTSYPDRIRAYRIVIDGMEVARINAGQSVDIPVAAGMHSVVARVDWCGSPTLRFNIGDGETIHLECASNLKGLRIFLAIIYVVFLRDQYLTLIRV